MAFRMANKNPIILAVGLATNQSRLCFLEGKNFERILGSSSYR